MDAWVVFVDAESGCQYYHNPKRQITTWDCPPELAIISAAWLVHLVMPVVEWAR